MRVRTISLATLALVGGSVAIAAGPASAASVDGDYNGCPSGYVCIYDSMADWDAGNVEHMYFEYGSYNFSEEYGAHVVLNHQYGGAKAILTTGYNGGGSVIDEMDVDRPGIVDLTPANSITLAE